MINLAGKPHFGFQESSRVKTKSTSLRIEPYGICVVKILIK